MADTWTYRQATLGDDLDALAPTLSAAFAEVRGALEAGRPVVIVSGSADLLGQGSPLDAAVATALLGMIRTLAIEGAKPGWRVNMVAAPAGHEEDVEAAITMLAAASFTGQLLQIGGANLGKVLP